MLKDVKNTFLVKAKDKENQYYNFNLNQYKPLTRDAIVAKELNSMEDYINSAGTTDILYAAFNVKNLDQINEWNKASSEEYSPPLRIKSYIALRYKDSKGRALYLITDYWEDPSKTLSDGTFLSWQYDKALASEMMRKVNLKENWTHEPLTSEEKYWKEVTYPMQVKQKKRDTITKELASATKERQDYISKINTTQGQEKEEYQIHLESTETDISRYTKELNEL